MIREFYRKERKLAAKFLAVGTVGFITNYSILYFCTAELKLHKIVGEILAMIVALHVTFALNDRWTYRLGPGHTKLSLSLKMRYILYLASNSFGSIMTIVLFALFSLAFKNFVSLAAAAILAMVWNYMVNKIFIWKKHPHVSGEILGAPDEAELRSRKSTA
jgi:putative flippase GtrA